MYSTVQPDAQVQRPCEELLFQRTPVSTWLSHVCLSQLSCRYNFGHGSLFAMHCGSFYLEYKLSNRAECVSRQAKQGGAVAHVRAHTSTAPLSPKHKGSRPASIRTLGRNLALLTWHATWRKRFCRLLTRLRAAASAPAARPICHSKHMDSVTAFC